MEHICLLKAKENLSEEEEKDMLDYLYTTQYQMRGIIAITLGKFLSLNDMQLHIAYRLHYLLENFDIWRIWFISHH